MSASHFETGESARDAGAFAASLIRQNLEQVQRLGELEEALNKRDAKHREDEKRIADQEKRVAKREDLIVLLQEQVQDYSSTEWAVLEEAQSKCNQTLQIVHDRDLSSKREREAMETELRKRVDQLKQKECTLSCKQIEFDALRKEWLEKLGAFFAQQVEKLQVQVDSVHEQKASFLTFKGEVEQRVRDWWNAVHEHVQSALQQQHVDHVSLVELSQVQLQNLDVRLQQADDEHAKYVQAQVEMEEMRRVQLAAMAEQHRQQQATLHEETSQVIQWRRENEQRERAACVQAAELAERKRRLGQARQRQASDIKQHFNELEESRAHQAKDDATHRQQLAELAELAERSAEQQQLQQQLVQEANQKMVALREKEAELVVREGAQSNRDIERATAEESLSRLASKVTGMLREIKVESARLQQQSHCITAEVGAVKLARDELESQTELAAEAKLRIFEHQEELSRRIRTRQVEEEKELAEQVQMLEQREKLEAELQQGMGAMEEKQAVLQKREEMVEAREKRVIEIKEAIKLEQGKLMDKQAQKAEELQQRKGTCDVVGRENSERGRELDEREQVLRKREKRAKSDELCHKATRSALKNAEQQIHEQARAAEALLKDNISRVALQQQEKSTARQQQIDEAKRRSDLLLAEKEAELKQVAKKLDDQQEQQQASFETREKAWKRKCDERWGELEKEANQVKAQRAKVEEEIRLLSDLKEQQQTDLESEAMQMREQRVKLKEEVELLGVLKEQQEASLEEEANQVSERRAKVEEEARLLGTLVVEQRSKFEEEARQQSEHQSKVEEEAKQLKVQRSEVEGEAKQLRARKKEQSAESARNVARKKATDQGKSNLEARSRGIDEASEVLRKKQAAHQNKTTELRAKTECLQNGETALAEREARFLLKEDKLRQEEEEVQAHTLEVHMLAKQLESRTSEVEDQSSRLKAGLEEYMEEQRDKLVCGEILKEQQMMLSEDCAQLTIQRHMYRFQQQRLKADTDRHTSATSLLRQQREHWVLETKQEHQKHREAELRVQAKWQELERWKGTLEQERFDLERQVTLQQNTAHNDKSVQDQARKQDRRRREVAARAKLAVDTKLEELELERENMVQKGLEYDKARAKVESVADLHECARNKILDAEALKISANKVRVLTQIKERSLVGLRQELLVAHEKHFTDAAEQRARDTRQLETLTAERMNNLQRAAKAQLAYLSAVDERTGKGLRSLNSKAGVLRAQEEELRLKADVLARLEQVLRNEKARCKRQEQQHASAERIVASDTEAVALHEEEIQRKEKQTQQLTEALHEQEVESAVALEQAVAAAESAHKQEFDRMREQHTSALKCASQLQQTEANCAIKRAVDAKEADCASMVTREKKRHAAALAKYHQVIETKSTEFAAAMRAKEEEYTHKLRIKAAGHAEYAENEGGLATSVQEKEGAHAAALAAKEEVHAVALAAKAEVHAVALSAKAAEYERYTEMKDAELTLALHAKEEELEEVEAKVEAKHAELSVALQAKESAHEVALAAMAKDYERYAEASETEMLATLKATEEAHHTALSAKEADCKVRLEEQEAKNASTAHHVQQQLEQLSTPQLSTPHLSTPSTLQLSTPHLFTPQLLTPDVKPSAAASSQMSLGEKAAQPREDNELLVVERRVLALGKRRMERERHVLQLREQQVGGSVLQLEKAQLEHQQHCDNMKILAEKKMASTEASRAELDTKKATFEEREQTGARLAEKARLELDADIAKAKSTEEMAAQRWEDASRLERTVSMQLFEAEKQLHAAEAQRRLVLDLGEHLWEHMQLALDGHAGAHQKQATVHRVLSESTGKGLHRDHERALAFSQGLLTWRAQLVQQSKRFGDGHRELQRKLGMARQQVEDLNQRLSKHGQEFHSRLQQLAADRLGVEQRGLLLDERETAVTMREADTDNLGIAEEELVEREKRWRQEEERLQWELEREHEKADELGTRLQYEQVQCEALNQRLQSVVKIEACRAKADVEVDEREQRLSQWAEQLRSQSDRLGEQSELLLERALGYNSDLELELEAEDVKGVLGDAGDVEGGEFACWFKST
jgi:hypothetical protein